MTSAGQIDPAVDASFAVLISNLHEPHPVIS
jgi:hypothetical protein